MNVFGEVGELRRESNSRAKTEPRVPLRCLECCPFFKGLTGRLVASKTSSQFSGLAQPTGGEAGRKDRIAARTSQGTESLYKLTWRQMKIK